MNKLLSLAFLALLTGPALGQAPEAGTAPPPWQGIWSGTLGGHEVRVCLADRGGYRFGAYYLMSNRRVINLERPDGDADLWIEQDNRDASRPRWTLSMDGEALAGRWTQAGTTRPVRLTRLAGPAMDEETCGSLVFNRPRFTPVRIAARRATHDGVAYTRLTADVGPAFGVTIASFALDGAAPATRRVNAALRGILPGAPETSEWFECVRGNLDTHGQDGGFEQTLEPTMLTARWLAARQHEETYCGGNHPNFSNRSRTFDLASGREVNLHDWLTARAVSRTRNPGSDEVFVTLTEPFRRFVVGPPARRADDDAVACRESILQAEFWDIRLTRTGLVFTPDLPHVVRACGEEYAVTFARLAPYLSAQGRAGAGSLQTVARPARRGRARR